MTDKNSNGNKKYKLYYFNLRGRAETIRLLLAAAGVPYQDIRFTQEEWVASYKSKSPSGQSPFLECPDGKTLVQSGAIARHLAKKHNLMGKSERDYYRIEWVLAQVHDVADELSTIVFSLPETREAAMKRFMEETAARVLQPLAASIQENGRGVGFVAGNSLSVADLELMSLSDQLRVLHPEVFKNFPQLEEHYELVLKSNKGVAHHVQTRPQTVM